MRIKTKDKRLYDFAVVLRKIRTDMGYTSAEKFSNQFGLNRSVYQRWESGEDFNVSSLVRLCDILQISVSDLLRMWENCNAKMPKTRMHNLVIKIKEEIATENPEHERLKKPND